MALRDCQVCLGAGAALGALQASASSLGRALPLFAYFPGTGSPGAAAVGYRVVLVEYN